MEVVTTSHIIYANDENATRRGKAEKKSGKRIGFNYIILKSLRESKKNDVVKCLYIKSLIRFGICVIKEGSYGDSKDSDGRDIKDRLEWQRKLHQQLQHKIHMPHLLGSFEENGNYYLVLERIKGMSIYVACRKEGSKLRRGLIEGTKLGLTFLDYLVQLVSLLDDLHKEQVIHRDVTATNFMITPEGKVAIIDMELSYSLKEQAPDPPFKLGTYGYMSPEQEATEQPAFSQDVFSVGAVILQVWAGISPTKITNAPLEELRRKVHFFIPDKIFADTIVRCLHPQSELRPSLSDLRKIILQYKEDLQNKRSRTKSILNPFNREAIDETIERAINTITSPYMADENQGWFSEELNTEKQFDKRKINKAWYASFSKGAAGVLYMLSMAKQLGFDTERGMLPVEQGLQLIESKYINRIEEVSPSLHFGSSGIAVCLATAIREGLIEPKTAHFEWIESLLAVNNTQLDYMYGMAGQGIAHFLCQPFLHGERIKNRLDQYVDSLLSKQEKNGSWVTSNRKKGNKINSGFSRGISGILFFLLEYAHQYNDKSVLGHAERGLQWVVKNSIPDQNSTWPLLGKTKKINLWWCQGLPGMALSFMKGYGLTGDERYKEITRKILLMPDSEILDNNLSQCHGLTGLGEIYLEAYNVFKEQEWLDRAGWIAQAIIQVKKELTKYGPYWLVEHERQPSADFMIGNSGIIHYLMRYCNPDKLKFPML